MRPIKHTDQSSKALPLCPKGQKVARPCPRGLAHPRAKTLSFPSPRRGTTTLEQWGGAPWGGGVWWREMAELQEINRGMKRPASKGKPKELTSPGRPAVLSRGAGCSGCSHLRQRHGWEVQTQHSRDPDFREETVSGRWGPRWWLTGPSHHHSENAASKAGQAAFLLPAAQFLHCVFTGSTFSASVCSCVK